MGYQENYSVTDFLVDRQARKLVRIGNGYNSVLGTSAGTVLGPILLIFAKDILEEIFPKFADDTVTIAIGDNCQGAADRRLIGMMRMGCC